MRTVFILREIRYWISFLQKVSYLLKWTLMSVGMSTSVIFVQAIGGLGLIAQDGTFSLQ